MTAQAHSEHDLYIGQQLQPLAEKIDTAIEYKGERAHFVLLLWTDGGDAQQFVSNTPREGAVAAMIAQAMAITNGDVVTGPPLNHNAASTH